MRRLRLHLGAKNLVEIPRISWRVLSNESWIHLGTEKPCLSLCITEQTSGESPKGRIYSYLKKSFRTLNGKTATKTESFPATGSMNHKELSIWKNSKLIPWYYRKGDILPFDNNMFTFVYSEHFFEHLFLDETAALFREIYRVMTRGAVCRTVVPDADLRVYEPPEPVGYPDINMAWNNPEKHKTRMSFNVLDEILKIAGFESRIGLVYCTGDGKFINRTPEICRQDYSGCIDTGLIFDMSYIARPKSLIVDAIRK